ncbi:MAG: hypothetical protein AAGI53_05060 [Planctomycetota bacterium]
MNRNTSWAVLVAASGLASTVASGEVINFDLAPDQQATVLSGPTSIGFGVEGSFTTEVERDGEGKLSDARLVAINLLVLSASVYDFGALGLVTLSNIGVSLEQEGGQEFFFNETAGSSQPGDFAGFLQTDNVAGLTGTLELDSDRDGTADQVTDLATIDEAFRTFEIEPFISRAPGESDYLFETFFQLDVETTSMGLPISFDIEFSGGGDGSLVPTPGSMTLAGLFVAVTFRRRRAG